MNRSWLSYPKSDCILDFSPTLRTAYRIAITTPPYIMDMIVHIPLHSNRALMRFESDD